MTVAALRTPESRLLTLQDGRRLRVQIWAGRGTPLVLLHGLLDSSDGWSDLCRATQRPCVAIDLAGFGLSDLPARPVFSSYADDVVQVLGMLGVTDFVLVGHSLGGGIATAVAERLGDRVQTLVLLAPAGFGRIGLAEIVSLPGIRDVVQRMLPFALGNRLVLSVAYRGVITNGRAATDQILDRVLDHEGSLVTAAREATKAVVRAGLSERAFHRRRLSFRNPVIAVWGDRDRLVPPSHLAGVHTAFPHVDGRIWEGIGHHHKSECPAQLSQLLETAAAQFDLQRAPGNILVSAAAAA